MKKFLIAANWKMNPAPEGFDSKGSPYKPRPDVDVVVFPTYLELYASINADLNTGGQCARPEPTGAFTGDISMQMLKDAGCMYVMCGHSDRRQFHHESDAFVADQAEAARKIGLIPIICIGERAEERDAGQTEVVIARQLKPLKIYEDSIIAYEPVWAISRGDPNKPAATKEDAQKMHALIRSMLPKDLQKSIRILYGGSMKGENAEELLSQPDIDGGLVGGASLKPLEFGKIIDAAAKLRMKD